MKRSDGRIEPSQLRAFAASQSLLNRADGSAKFSFGMFPISASKPYCPFASELNCQYRLGESTVIASVVGPAEVKIRDEKMDEATVEVIVRPAVGFPSTKDKLLERALRQTVEPTILAGMMPRTLIQIVVQIVQEDGNMLSTAVNAISLAMLDAGLPMNSLAAAVSAVIDQEGNLLLDPNSKELEVREEEHGHVCYATALTKRYLSRCKECFICTYLCFRQYHILQLTFITLHWSLQPRTGTWKDHLRCGNAFISHWFNAILTLLVLGLLGGLQTCF